MQTTWDKLEDPSEGVTMIISPISDIMERVKN